MSNQKEIKLEKEQKDKQEQLATRAAALVSADPPAAIVANSDQLLAELKAHKLALEKLKSINATTTRLLETSQEIAHVGSVELDLTTREYIWSKETYRIHDADPEHYTPTLDDSLDSYLPGSRERVKQGLTRAITKGEIFDLEVQKRTFSGRRIDIRSTCLITSEDGKPKKLTGIYQDITKKKRAERHHIHHNKVLKMLLDDCSLSKILHAMAMGVEEINPDFQCSILLLDKKTNTLRHGASASLPNFYTQAINGAKIGVGMGSCGEAAYTGKRVIVENINTHQNWSNFIELTQRAKLHACWSEPIIDSDDEVLGTFALYLNQPSAPLSDDIAMLEGEAQLAALAIEKTRAETQLKLAASVFTNAKEGIVITDLGGNILDVNTTFVDITGYERDEVIGRNPRLLRSDKHEPYFYAQMWRSLIKEGFWSGEIWNIKKSGEAYAAMMTISAVRDNDGNVEHYVSLFNDISLLKEHQRQLEYIAHFDALTQLPNRVLLADRLNQAIATSNRNNNSLAVLFLDLDGFKAVNDTYGHSLGDHLLVTISHRLKATMREGDTLARLGGDEFIAVLTGLNNAVEHKLLVRRLLEAASEPVAIEGKLLQLSASIGLTLYPADNSAPDQLIRNADQAMYRAKQAGKNCYQVFDVELNSAMRSRYESIEQIRRGFKQNELVLFYQPKVNMRTGEIIGVEALIRWRHPVRGLLMPEHFLPVIDANSIGLEIGEWVIREALAQLQVWGELGFTTNVSVNVSGQQLLQPNFVEHLDNILQDFPTVPPERLTLEVLETSALEDVIEVADIMRRCGLLGIEFAVDDFGTGYSSLTYLKRLPASLLKIDQSFIRDMLEDPDDMAIVKGVISLANAFQRSVIAEGLENNLQGEKLLTLGCDLAQGYAIAKPMAAENVPNWAQGWVQDAIWQQHPMQENLPFKSKN